MLRGWSRWGGGGRWEKACRAGGAAGGGAWLGGVLLGG